MHVTFLLVFRNCNDSAVLAVSIRVIKNTDFHTTQSFFGEEGLAIYATTRHSSCLSAKFLTSFYCQHCNAKSQVFRTT